MIKRSIIFLTALAILNSSCKETLCEKGVYPFCEEDNNTPSVPGTVTEKSVGPRWEETSSFVIDGKGYIGNGRGDIMGAYTTFSVYSPETDTWNSVASMPGEGRFAAVSFATKKKGYVGGGTGFVRVDGEDQLVNLTDFYEYDPKADVWTKKADMPGGTGYYFGFAIGERSFVVKGDKMWEYNASKDTWIAKENLPVVLTYGNTFTIGHSGYVLSASKLYEFNSLTEKWSVKAASPVYSGATFAIERKGYVVSNDYIYEYNSVKDSWIQKRETPIVKEQNDSGVGSGIQDAFPIGNKGYFSTVYRANPEYFFEYDPNK